MMILPTSAASGATGSKIREDGGSEGVAASIEFYRDNKVGLMIVANMRHPSVYPRGAIHALVRRIVNPPIRLY